MSRLTQLTQVATFDCAPLSVAYGDRQQGTVFVGLESGEVVKAEAAAVLKFVNHAKLPEARLAGLTHDASGALIAADTANQVLLKIDAKGRSETYVGDYESKSLLGPQAVVVNPDNGQVFFTDSGLPGETGLHRPKGSLFATNELGQLVALSFQNLAYPSSVALSPNGDEVFVAEKAANRILRFVKVAGRVWEGTVFAQLAGGTGPVAVAVTNTRRVIVAHSELPHFPWAATGKLTVLNEHGEVESIALDLPASDVSDIEVSPDNRKLLVAVKSTKAIYTYDLTN